MSELTLLVLRFGFLLLLWLFVLGVVYAMRADLFGRTSRRAAPSAASAPVAAPAPAPKPTFTVPPPAPRPAPAPVAAPTDVVASTSTVSKVAITSGPRAGTEIPLTGTALSIGRSSDSAIILKDDFTSTHHAKLVLWGNDWMLQDMDSTNGTFLSGKRVSVPTPIHLGDVIKIGASTLELRR